MRVQGPDWLAHVHLNGAGRVNHADRAVSFLLGKSVGDILAQAARCNWTVELSAEECRQVTAGSEGVAPG